MGIYSASAHSRQSAYMHLMPSCKPSQECVLSTKEPLLAQLVVIPLAEEISLGRQTRFVDTAVAASGRQYSSSERKLRNWDKIYSLAFNFHV